MLICIDESSHTVTTELVRECFIRKQYPIKCVHMKNRSQESIHLYGAIAQEGGRNCTGHFLNIRLQFQQNTMGNIRTGNTIRDIIANKGIKPSDIDKFSGFGKDATEYYLSKYANEKLPNDIEIVIMDAVSMLVFRKPSRH